MSDTTTQADFFDALNSVSHLPPSREHPNRRPIWSLTNGLRIFGWTHAYNVPYLLHWLEKEGPPAEAESVSTP